MYHGFARSVGLIYWESLGYTFAGSTAWEIAGENTAPSRNDKIASGIAGTFLGESLLRMADMVLEHQNGLPQIWHEVAATAISPATGFNRWAFGNRFKTVFPSHDPAYFSRLNAGFSGTTQNSPGLSKPYRQADCYTEQTMRLATAIAACGDCSVAMIILRHKFFACRARHCHLAPLARCGSQIL